VSVLSPGRKPVGVRGHLRQAYPLQATERE
jgi:hypothetical protein